MTPEQNARVREILRVASDLPAGQRSTYLDETCGGDADLRVLLQSLLPADRETDLIVGPIERLPRIETSTLTMKDAGRTPKPSGQMIENYRGQLL